MRMKTFPLCLLDFLKFEPEICILTNTLIQVIMVHLLYLRTVARRLTKS